MIFPTISNVAADSISSVPKDYRMAAYGLGSTRWQSIYKVVLPAAGSGILSGIILGLARAFGEALAVAMVIGQTTALPTGIFSTTKSLNNGDCGTDGKCDRRWRDEDSTLDNGITVICIVSYIYSADSLFLQTEERQRVRRRREDEQNKTCAWNQ